MLTKRRISRRRLLRGACAAVAIPFLDAMIPAVARSAEVSAGAPKTRGAWLYFPNGVADGGWEPRRVGRDGRLQQLNRWMAPLEPFKSQLIVFGKVWTPRGNGHGAGTATWLTGGGYDGKKIDAGGISVDQLAAAHVGRETLLPSLELSARGEGFFSNSLPRNTISWSRRGTPVPRDVEPRIVFDRMFRSGTRGVSDQSVLDQILADARSLRRSVGPADVRKLDEYLEAVRSVEKRIEFAAAQADRARRTPALAKRLVRPPEGIPDDHREYMRLMFDMQVLAFWADATRVSTFMLDHGQSNRYFNFIDGVRGTWHALSHWRDASGKTEDDDGTTSWNSVNEKRDMYHAVVRWHHEQVAYLLGRLQEIRESDGRSLLDNTLVLYGSSIADGHEHAAKNLPLVLAGGGGGTIRSGRVIRFKKDTSLSTLHLSMLQRLGVPAEEFAESDSAMSEIDA